MNSRDEIYSRKSGILHCEDVPLASIADEYGTPVYVYSFNGITSRLRAWQNAFAQWDPLICYSVKANSAQAVLSGMAGLSSGFDIVSGGELYRVLQAGGNADRIVYAGVGKTEREIREAVKAGIFMFNVESEHELESIASISSDEGVQSRIAFRVNPDVDPKTHPYITTGHKKAKFGIDVVNSARLYRKAAQMNGVDPVGVHFHIGSQLMDIEPFHDALLRTARLVEDLRSDGIHIETVNLGGGLGVQYSNSQQPPEPARLAKSLEQTLNRLDCRVIIEPGRSIAANPGVLVVRVIGIKKTAVKIFVIVDGAMNDLIRPSLYGAHHDVRLVHTGTERRLETVDIVGPVCETGDFLARDRKMELPEPGELITIMDAGAYGYSMSSNYNSRLRPAQVLVQNDRSWLISERQTYADLLAGEHIPESLRRRSGSGS